MDRSGSDRPNYGICNRVSRSPLFREKNKNISFFIFFKGGGGAGGNANVRSGEGDLGN